MLKEPFLRRLVVVRCDRQDTVHADPLVLARELDDFARVVAAGAGEDGHAPGDLVHHQLNDPDFFAMTEGRRLSGRTARRDEVHVGVDLPAHQPPHGGLVYAAVFPERRDERGTETSKRSSHGEPTSRLKPAPT